MKLGDVAAADVQWKSSKKKVAAVSSKGVITAKSEGTATITATYQEKKYTCKVTVVDSNKEENKIEAFLKEKYGSARYTQKNGRLDKRILCGRQGIYFCHDF